MFKSYSLTIVRSLVGAGIAIGMIGLVELVYIIVRVLRVLLMEEQ
jgi:hypothetical protein